MNKEYEKKEYERIEKIDKIKMFGTELNVYRTFNEPYFMAKEVADWIEYDSFTDKEKTKRNVTAMLSVVDGKFIAKFIVKADSTENNIDAKNRNGVRNYHEMLFFDKKGLIQLLSKLRNKKSKLALIELTKDENLLDFSCFNQLKFDLFLYRVINNLSKKFKLKKLLKYDTEVKINKYRVDFYFPKLKLIVEYDEPYHESNKQMKKDKNRQEKLESLGFKVLRVRESNISTDIADLISYLMIKIIEYKKKDKKTIKAIDYIDNLEEKHRDEIRHVKVKRIK